MSTISDAVSKKRDEGDEPSRETRGPRVVRVEVPKDNTVRNMLLAGLVAALALTGIFVGGYFVLAQMGVFPPRPAAGPGTVSPSPGGNEQAGPTISDPASVDHTDGGAPTNHTTNIAETPSLPKLQGIFPDRVDPSALINGRSVRPGGVVDGYTLKAISSDRVTLERDGRQYELVLE